ncbi:hypothetical protein [Streptomyces sp. NPDC001985]
MAPAKTPAPLFDGRVEDVLVHDGAGAHGLRPHLTARETGQAVAGAPRG